jgi:hypothetical protein
MRLKKSGIPFAFLFLLFFSALYSQQSLLPSGPQDTVSPAPDSLAEVELMQIDGSSRFTLENPNAGDTLSYIITVEWINPRIPFFILPPESLSFSGFRKEAASTDHRKISKIVDGKPTIINKSEFTYKLRAITPGSGKASSARLPYYSALSQEKEYLPIGPHLTDILPARVPVIKKWYFQVILWLLAAGVLFAAVKFLLIWMKQNRNRNRVVKIDFKDELKELKARLQFAESKDLLLQMENISLRFLKQELPKSASGNFDALLKRYLELKGDDNRDNWLRLQQDFELAKFGGGRKESHELLESYRALKTCLHLKEDKDNE